MRKAIIGGMGGGGDILSSLPTVWNMKQVNPSMDISLAGIIDTHISNIDNRIPIILAGKEARTICYVTRDSSCEKDRLIEAVIADIEDNVVLMISVADGLEQVTNELQVFIKEGGYDGIVLVDAGTDSLVTWGSMYSIVTDTIAVAMLSQLRIKYKVHGLTSLCSDQELDFHTAMVQLSRMAELQGYYGSLSFPNEKLDEFREILAKVLQEYPTGTPYAILRSLEGKYGNEMVKISEYRGVELPVFGIISSLTFYLDPEKSVQVNEFGKYVLDTNSRKEAEIAFKQFTKDLADKEVPEMLKTSTINRIKDMYFWLEPEKEN